MAVWTEETLPYEVLMRFADAGPKKGQLTGAHFQTITTVYKDGVRFGVPEISQPQQLALVVGESGQLLSEVLGQALTGAIASNLTLTTQLDQALLANEGLASDLHAAQVTISDLEAQLAAAQAQIQSLGGSMRAGGEAEAEPALEV